MSGNFYGGQFYGGGFFGAIAVDTHDGFDGNKKRHKKLIQDRLELREQIRFAIEGKSPEIVEALEAVATPQIADSVYIPLSERIDMDKLSDEIVAKIRKELRRLDDEAVIVYMLTH